MAGRKTRGAKAHKRPSGEPRGQAASQAAGQAASQAASQAAGQAADQAADQAVDAAGTAGGTVDDGRRRAVIESVRPEVDGGRFAAKRVLGDVCVVECDAFTDGHDRISAVILYRPLSTNGDEAGGAAGAPWREAPLHSLVNDAWIGEFVPDAIGRWEYTVEAWVDRFKTWRHDLGRRTDEKDIAVHLLDGAAMLAAAAARAEGDAATSLSGWSRELGDTSASVAERRDLALRADVGELALAHADRSLASRRERPLELVVDDALAGFSAWYEFFPRSTVEHPGNHGARPHGTFADAVERLPYVADLGFDIVYFPPISPIGRVNRKGRNNSLEPDANDVGVCWAIGSDEGGHAAVLPALGTLEDFRRVVDAARGHDMEIALDIAFQCAPDHPWVKEHPDWFRWRADDTVQFAENPPKKYQDIYPLDFECDDWQGLWNALRDVFLFWMEQGVRVFRVDNPHTKPYPFWEWVIGEVKRERPDAIFLAEAFTRPKVMHRLAKLGYSHSYTYFTWRNTKEELEEYLLEVSGGPGIDYFRPNFWPNTPDILHESLQTGGLSGSALRYVLAATMSSNYGIYGPVFELGYVTPRESGSEEYLDSEKYQLRHWRLDSPDSLAPLIRKVNGIRRANRALQDTCNASLHRVDNEALVCFSKTTRGPLPAVGAAAAPGSRSGLRGLPLEGSADASSADAAGATGATSGAASGTGDDAGNTVIVVVNLDPRLVQAGWTSLDLEALGIGEGESFTVVDLLDEREYTWTGRHNFVELDPQRAPAHILLLRR